MRNPKSNLEQYTVVGQSIPKIDATEKVTGSAQFLIDIELPNMLYGKILRSGYPHARIARINTEKAKRVPGVVAIITAKDTPLIKFGFMKDQLPLKHGKVKSVRDEVAAVAAVDEETAAKALELIEVEYEELPPVFDPYQAMKPDAPIIHEEMKSNTVNLPFNFKHGDVERAFKECYRVVENTFKVNFVTTAALGTMGCIARFDERGDLTVWTNTQAPFEYQKDLGEANGIRGSRIRVIQPKIGGSFGRGMDVYPIDIITVLLAKKTGRPVKIVFNREEEFSASPTRQPCIFRIKTGAKRDGTLLARDAELYMDNGPYVSWGAFDARVMMATVCGLYKVPNVRFNAHVVYTNNPYSGTVRGAGNPQSTFAVESQMDMLADELGIDRLEFRLKNANEPGYITPQGMKITSCKLGECLNAAASRIGWKGRHKAGRNRGIGFASYFHVGGGARVFRSDGCGAIVKIDDFGKVTLITGATEIGTGSDTAMCQIVAEELQIPVENVQIVNDDSSIRPWDVGTHASRTTFIGGNAALLAARKAKQKLLEIAAKVLEEDVTNLEVKNGIVSSKIDSKKTMPYDTIVRRGHFKLSGEIIIAEAFYDPPNEMQDENYRGNISVTYGFGTQAALVEVDRDTGKVSVLRFVSVHDAGSVINPMLAESVVQGGVAMGVGLALTEQLIVEQGRVMNASFADYKLLTSLEAPPIEVQFVESSDDAGPFGAKGVGEAGVIPTAAAIANAIYDAVKVRVTEIPMTPEKILTALEHRQ